MKTLQCTPESVAAMFNVPLASVKKQYAKNAAHIRTVIAKLEQGIKVRGYSQDDLPALRASAEQYERNSQ